MRFKDFGEIGDIASMILNLVQLMELVVLASTLSRKLISHGSDYKEANAD